MGIKVAAIQTGPVVKDPEKTITKAFDWIDRAAEAGVKLAVFPEMYYPGYEPLIRAKNNQEKYEDILEEIKELAEPIPGETSRRIGAKAKDCGMHLVFAMLEKDENDNLFNATVLFNDQGEILNVHRKTILTPSLETPELSTGDEYNVSKTELGVIGQIICADASCPETSRILSIKGAQIICLSMGGFRIMWKGRELMDPVMEYSHASRTRAVDNSVFYIVANLSCRLGDFEFFGKSRIINYFGDLLAMGGEGPDKEELVTAEIDLEELKEIPIKLMDRRRPEIYGQLLTPNDQTRKITGEFLMSSDK